MKKLVININSASFYIILFFSIITPLITAHFDSNIISLTNKVLYLSMTILFFIKLKRCKMERFLFIVKKPTFIFFIYLFLQNFITIITAENNLKIAFSNTLFVFLFFCVFMISALSSGFFKPYRLKSILELLLIIAFVSIVLDYFGYTGFFLSTADSNLERLGFKQIHGFMPWPNIFATFLLVISILISIVSPSNYFSKLGYLLVILTMVRAHIFTSLILIFLNFKKKYSKIIFILVVFFATIFFIKTVDISEMSEFTMSEINLENNYKVYRLAYISESRNILEDYPLFGVGINRLTNRAIWEFDNFYFHLKYEIPSTLFEKELNTSDTGITFFAEIGLIGILFYLLMTAHFFYLCLKMKEYRYLSFLIPQITLLYSYPSLILSLYFGIFYFFFYGLLIARNFSERDGFLHDKKNCLS